MPFDPRRIRDARRRARLTQAEAAERAGWSQGTWADIERGRHPPNIRTLEAMAAALGCGLGALISPHTPGTADS